MLERSTSNQDRSRQSLPEITYSTIFIVGIDISDE